MRLEVVVYPDRVVRTEPKWRHFGVRQVHEQARARLQELAGRDALVEAAPGRDVRLVAVVAAGEGLPVLMLVPPHDHAWADEAALLIADLAGVADDGCVVVAAATRSWVSGLTVPPNLVVEGTVGDGG